jgi:starvation-inducible DNA-binding protein
MHKTRIDLPEETRSKVVELLNKRLADALDLYSHAKQAHWNVKGMHFKELHELFDEVATRALGHIDEIAERITALAGTAFGTVQVAAKNSSLQPYPLDVFDGKAHVNALASSLAAFGKAVRQGIDETDRLGDKDTADLFTQVSRAVDKDLWFVEAHLQAGS